MAVEVEVVESSNVVRLKVSGVFGFSLMNDFKQAYQQFETGEKVFVVDLEDAAYIESYGVGMLLSLREANSPDSKVQIINANETIREVLKHAHILDYFELVS